MQNETLAQLNTLIVMFEQLRSGTLQRRQIGLYLRLAGLQHDKARADFCWEVYQQLEQLNSDTTLDEKQKIDWLLKFVNSHPMNELRKRAIN